MTLSNLPPGCSNHDIEEAAGAFDQEASDYPGKNQLAHYFSGVQCNIDNNFQTVPQLLRVIADFMEQNVIRDAEFDDLTFRTNFDDGDEHHEFATLYYHAEDLK